MMARNTRHYLEVITAVLWGGTITAAILEIALRLYLAVWLATLISSLWVLAVYMTRPDHGILAHARLQYLAMRADGALRVREETTDRPPTRLQTDTPTHETKHLGHVA